MAQRPEQAIVPGAVPAALPSRIRPQLPALAKTLPKTGQWFWEIKYDGWRMLARIDQGKVRLFTRNGLDWTDKVQPLRRALEGLRLPSGWYDGEVVIPGEHGVPDFGALQRSFSAGGSKDLKYYVFDAPYLAGYDLRRVALEQRRSLLSAALEGSDDRQVRFSETLKGDPLSLLHSACKLRLEGIIGKKAGSPYQEGRSASWVKLKCKLRQNFVIIGFYPGRGGVFSSLRVGYFEKGQLVDAGRVRTGFARWSHQIQSKLDERISPESPVQLVLPKIGIRWVRPELVCEVEFMEWTRRGRMRYECFVRLKPGASPLTAVRAAPSAVA